MTQQRSVNADKSFILVMLRNLLPCASISRYKAVLFATDTLHRSDVD
jgi:hypothetical protein